MKCTNVTIQSRHHSRNSNSLRLKAKYRNVTKFLTITLFSVDSNKTREGKRERERLTDRLID